jgi:hypothetical protein
MSFEVELMVLAHVFFRNAQARDAVSIFRRTKGAII